MRLELLPDPSTGPRQRPQVFRQAEVLAVVNRHFDERRAVGFQRLHEGRIEIGRNPAIPKDRA